MTTKPAPVTNAWSSDDEWLVRRLAERIADPMDTRLPEVRAYDLIREAIETERTAPPRPNADVEPTEREKVIAALHRAEQSAVDAASVVRSACSSLQRVRESLEAKR